ncbi:hypothetical protein D9M71_470680 [compost metagenome]
MRDSGDRPAIKTTGAGFGARDLDTDTLQIGSMNAFADVGEDRGKTGSLPMGGRAAVGHACRVPGAAVINHLAYRIYCRHRQLRVYGDVGLGRAGADMYTTGGTDAAMGQQQQSCRAGDARG